MFQMKHGARNQYVVGQEYVDIFRKVNCECIAKETALSKEDFCLLKKHSNTSVIKEPPTKQQRLSPTDRMNGFYMLSSTRRSVLLVIEFTSRFGGDAWYFQAASIVHVLRTCNRVGPMTDDYLYEALSNM